MISSLALPKYLDLSTVGAVICDGNSITAGSRYGHTWVTEIQAMQPFATTGCLFYNFGVGGQTTTQMLSDQETQVLPLITTKPPTILIALEFGNQISSAITPTLPQDAFELYRQYCLKARRCGAYVVACTAHARLRTGDLFYPQDLETCNQLLRDRWREFADALFDCRTIPQLSVVTADFFPDEIHPTREANILFANGLIQVLRQIPIRS
jgi:hypothetical protein